MPKRYIEMRKVESSAEGVAADIARYAQDRQHLGAALVLCSDSAMWTALVRKQWLKLARELQRRRSLATDAVEILKYTYTITQMQHMQFAQTASSDSRHEALMVFGSSFKAAGLEAGGLSLYVLDEADTRAASAALAHLASNALVVDYSGHLQPETDTLEPRIQLEAAVQRRWSEVLDYLTRHRVTVEGLVPTMSRAEAMDDAIDGLLDDNEAFLQLAGAFARALELARPLETTSPALRMRYELMLVLAHRVQGLSTSGFNERFLKIYADDARFLHDVSAEASPRELARQALAQLMRALELPEPATV